jgi:hypothetical protein
MIQVKLVSKVGRVRGSGRGLPPSLETIPTSEEARICTECTLPPSFCDKGICKRWARMKRELRSVEK